MVNEEAYVSASFRRCTSHFVNGSVAHRHRAQANLSSEDAPVRVCGCRRSATLPAVPNPFVRSKLFVPGARTALFPKAFSSGADALSFDLEDAVRPEDKVQARAEVAKALRSATTLAHRPLLIARINALDSAWFDADVQAMAAAGPDWVNLPKASCAADVHRAASALQAAEAAAGRFKGIGLLVTIESAAALHRAAEIAAAHPCVVGLQLGLGDLFEPLRIARGDVANVHAAMFALRMAAGSAGVFAYDGAFPDIADPAGFRAEAAMSKRLGYVGKSCIHPSQVALANAAFSPDADDLAQARRLVAAAARAESEGRAAFTFEGRMVDLPFVKRAQALLAAAAS